MSEMNPTATAVRTHPQSSAAGPGSISGTETAMDMNHGKRFGTWQPLLQRDFRLLWVGQSISSLGDQFYLVALPWLILQLTGSSLKLGAVMLAATIPRVVFQLLGGAASDRIKPHKLMLVSNILRGVVCVILTGLVIQGWVRLWHLFVLAAAFGTVDAFFYPALRNFIPSVMRKDELPAANALLQGSNMLVKFLGPSLAGAVIAAVGVGSAFGLDTISFLIAAFCLILIQRKTRLETVGADSQPAQQTNLLASIREGLAYSLRHPMIRSLIIIVAVIEFSFAGPFSVGLAALATDKFAGDSRTFGALLSSIGGGLLFGTMLAGWLKISKRLGAILIPLSLTLSLLLLLLGQVSNVIVACFLAAMMGLIGGYLQVLIAVWLQTKPDPQMRGRVFSVVLLCGFGLTPLSYPIAGALANINVGLMFTCTAIFLCAVTVFCGISGITRPLAEE